MPGLSKVIVLDANARARRQVQLGFEREGVPSAAVAPDAPFEPGGDAGLVVVGGADGQALELVRRARGELEGRQIDVPIVFAGRGVRRGEAEAAGADEVVLPPAYLRDVVTIGRLLLGQPAAQRAHLTGNLVELTGVYSLVRALAALGRSATLTLTRGLRRGEIRFYHGEVTSAQVGMIHGQAALHQLLLWTDARFAFHHEDIVRRQQIPLSSAELFADAERFLEGVRESSGTLSPSIVLAQDVERMQALGKQIPTEVYGVLRMFDGHRVLADVLEDSPYRVYETLRVAQRAVEAGLLRAVDRQAPRPTWRAVLPIEEWLLGSDRETAVEPAPAAAATGAPQPPVQAREAREARGKRKPRRKKKRRVTTQPPTPIRAAPSEIDWGPLVPRVVGAEVGPLSGVVPAAHVSGEIIATPSQDPRDALDPPPSIMLDDAASPAEVDDTRLRDTKPERIIRSDPAATPVSAPPDAAIVDTTEATTERVTRPRAARADEAAGPAEPPPDAPVETTTEIAGPVASAPELARPVSAAPSVIEDEPSDGVIRDPIGIADTAPVKRNRLPSDPPEDDRPEMAAGEITMPRSRPTVERRPSEPTILVADLAAVHQAVSEISDQVTAPRVNAASPALEAHVAVLRGDAVAFSDAEEAFFRAGHDKEAGVAAAPVTESFDDLDEGYRPVGFWDRLRGKPGSGPDAASAEPTAPTDEPTPAKK